MSSISYTSIPGPRTWITVPGLDPARPVFFRARRQLRAITPLRELTLQITAHSMYRLWIQGELAGQGPARGTQRLGFFDTYALPALPAGQSLWLAVEVAHVGPATFRYADGPPGLWAAITELGGVELAETFADWEVGFAEDWRTDVPRYTLQLGPMEWRDTRRIPVGWQVGEDRMGQASWQPALLSPMSDAFDLRPRDVAGLCERVESLMQLKAVARVHPAPITPENLARHLAEEPWLLAAEPFGSLPRVLDPVPGGWALLLEGQRPFTAGVEIDVVADAGTVVDIAYGEHAEDGRIRSYLAMGGDLSYRFADRMICSGGRQTIGPTLLDRGGRWTQLVIREMSGPVVVEAVRLVDRRHPMGEVATFRCSNAEWNALWEAGVETLSACATDTLIDCPWRESALWVNDLLVEAPLWSLITADASLPLRCLRLALSQVRPDGLIYGVCPSPEDATYVLYPVHSFLPIILDQIEQLTGTLAEPGLFAAVCAAMEAAGSYVDAHGIPEPPAEVWNFVDWSYPWRQLDGRRTAVVSLFRVLGLQAAARLVERRGERARATVYAQEAAQTGEAVTAMFYDPVAGLFREFDEGAQVASELTQALAILALDLPDTMRQGCAEALQRTDLLPCELYMQHMIFQALDRLQRPEAIAERITAGWLPMIRAGSPTIWEANVLEKGPAAFQGAGSLCHGFSTAPLAWLLQAVAGVRPLAPGWQRWALAPVPAGCFWSEAEVPTPWGRIHARTREVAGQTHWQVVVPVGTTCQLPDGRLLAAGDHEGILAQDMAAVSHCVDESAIIKIM